MVQYNDLIHKMMDEVCLSKKNLCYILGADSPNISPFSSGNKMIKGEDGSSILIIDQYKGHHPFIIDKEFAKNGKSEVLFCPALILDSNVASSFSENLLKNKNIFSSNAVGKLLLYLLERFNNNQIGFYLFPNFYCLESA